jgi:hypothetical protein
MPTTSMPARSFNTRREAPRLGFRQELDQFRLGLEGLEVDEIGAELPREAGRNAFLGDITAFHQNPAEFAAGALLFLERQLELLARNKVLLDQHVTKADFFRTCHQAISIASLRIGAFAVVICTKATLII